MQKSGSHTSIPRFRPDKLVPKRSFAGETLLSELTTNQAQAVKKHAHKKQRQHDKRLVKACQQCGRVGSCEASCPYSDDY